MNPYQETFETWNKVAALYEEQFMGLDLYNDTYDVFCDLLTPNCSILEIGCGPGNITKYMLEKRPDLTVLGLDIAPNMVELARENNPSASFEIMDSREIDQLTAKFHAIISGFCLPYLSPSDCSKLIKDSPSLMNNNGSLYLSFVEGDATNSGYQKSSSGNQVYFYYHDLTLIKKDLIENDFKILELIHKDYPKQDGTIEIHTILIAQKNVSNS